MASERNARTLVHLVKALAQLQDLRRGGAGGGGRGAQRAPAFAGDGAGYPDPEERPPRSLAELREELARRLEVIRAEHEGQAGNG